MFLFRILYQYKNSNTSETWVHKQWKRDRPCLADWGEADQLLIIWLTAASSAAVMHVMVVFVCRVRPHYSKSVTLAAVSPSHRQRAWSTQGLPLCAPPPPCLTRCHTNILRCFLWSCWCTPWAGGSMLTCPCWDCARISLLSYSWTLKQPRVPDLNLPIITLC